MGPDSILEMGAANQIHVLKGELKVSPFAEDAGLQLLPGNLDVTESSVFRAVETEGSIKLTKLEATPPWLKGFEEVNSVETMGSLIAQVDGRDVPLSVGYHHVSVEIRD